MWGARRDPVFAEIKGELSSKERLLWKPDKTLYHYTNAAGLKGIIEKKALWLTDVSYMNDAGELSYATQLIIDLLEDKKSGAANALDLLAHLQESVTWFRESFVVHAACFCERSNLLSQWRSYGLYAIGFQSANAIRVERHHTVLDRWRPATFRKVEYTLERQQRLVAAAIDRVVTAFLRDPTREGRSRTSVIQDYGTFFSDLVSEYLVSFKDPAFSEEEEWRLIHTTLRRPDTMNMSFRLKGDYIVPYIEMPIRAVDDKAFGSYLLEMELTARYTSSADYSRFTDERGFFPIEEIVVGPTLQVELATQSVQMLLQQSQLANVPVVSSNVPLRGGW